MLSYFCILEDPHIVSLPDQKKEEWGRPISLAELYENFVIMRMTEGAWSKNEDIQNAVNVHSFSH